jgi:hypothetical protein
MVTSQNGYTANDQSKVSSRLVPGTTRRLTVRNGPAGDLLLWVAAQFDVLVEDIEQGILDDWGYAERPVRGGTDLSNHASGTAVDLNATAHPLATTPSANFSAAEIARIHAIVARTEGCVRWGGDYVGRKDGMHFEIGDGVTEARCAAVLAKLTAAGGAATAGEDEDMTPDQSRKLDEVVEQLTGSRDADKYPGFQSFKYPNDPKARATVTDFIRHIDENLINLAAAVTALGKEVAALKAAKGAGGA